MKQLTIKILLLIIAAYLASAFIYAGFDTTIWAEIFKTTIGVILMIAPIALIIFSIHTDFKRPQNKTN